jgi:predicted DNA-binding transcriptional regulator AlpA
MHNQAENESPVPGEASTCSSDNRVTGKRAPAGPALAPLLLRAAQAAAYCGVSEATWWRWDDADRIPRGRKISPGVKLWSRPDLELWAALGCPSRTEFEARQLAKQNGRR